MNIVPYTANLVKFINTQDYVVNFSNKLNHIAVEYIVDRNVKVTFKDWVALFPKDCGFWRTLNLDLMVAYEFVLGPPVDDKERKYKMQFSLKGARNLVYGREYQFVYYTCESEILGVSDAFKFLKLVHREVWPKSSVNVASQCIKDKDQTRIEDGEPFRKNKNFIKNHRVRQGSLNVQDEIWPQRNENSVKVEDSGKQRQKSCSSQPRNDVPELVNKWHHLKVNGPTSDSQLVPSQKASACSNCDRVGKLLATQAELYSQIKNLAEINDDLQQEVIKLRRQVELGQASYQKLFVMHNYERDLNLLYRGADKRADNYPYQIVCGYQQVFMGLDYFHRPIFAIHPILQYAPLVSPQVFVVAPTVRDPIVHKYQHAEEKSKLGSTLRLKAMIGSQEEKIRSLTAQLTAGGEVQKVTTVMRNIEKFDCGDQNFNNNIGEDPKNNE